jgi:hypothetical protein
MYPTYWINQKLREAINSNGPVPRFAGMWYNNRFEVYMLGGEKIAWNPEDDVIELFPPYKIEVDEFKIDTSLIRQLYEKYLASKKEKKKVDEYAKDKEELGITKKHLNEKDKETIQKYKNAILSSKTNR